MSACWFLLQTVLHTIARVIFLATHILISLAFYCWKLVHNSISLRLKPTLLSKSSRSCTTFSIISLTIHSLNPRHSGLLPSVPHLLHSYLPHSLSSTWPDENALNPGTFSSVPGHHILLAPSGFFQSPLLAHLPLLDYACYSVPRPDLRQSPPPYTRIFFALMTLDNIYVQIRPCYGLTCVPTPNS